MMKTRCLLAAFFWAACAGDAAPSFGQLPVRLADSVNSPQPNAASADASPKAKRVENAERLRTAEMVLQSVKDATPNGAQPPEEASREVQLRKQIDRVYAQHEAVRAETKALQQSLITLQGKLKALQTSGPAEPPPYSYLLVDRLKDELATEQARGDSLSATVAELSTLVARHKATYEDKERARRKAKEAHDTSNDEAAKPKLAEALTVAELESRLANAEWKLHQDELANEKIDQQVHKLQVEFLQTKIGLLEKKVEFTNTDLQNRLAELDNEEIQQKRSLEAAEANTEYLENQWFQARQRLEQAAEKTPALNEEVDARRVARETQQRQVAVLNQRLQRLVQSRTAWNRRYKLATALATAEERATWQQETQKAVEDLSREARLQTIRLDEVRNNLATLDGRIKGAESAPPELARWLNQQRDALLQLRNLYDENLAGIESDRRLFNRLLAEVSSGEQAAPGRNWLAVGWEWVGHVWNYEISSVDDSPITVGKIITGLILLIVGFILSRRLSRLFGRRLLRRLKVHESAAAALQSVMFYVLLIVFAMIALRFANVPLTAFTILGGAIALGVGFGSQNIINNFMSGLILLAERPIRVGDMIQLEDLYGTVEKIGARSTRIRTGENLEIVVPNSSFLENNVINWTLSEDTVRTRVNVGIVYGSPTREATRLMLRAATEHGKILPQPEPFVWFIDFGDNSLNFQLHFWLRARTLSDRRRIESDIRYRIDNLFREAGIVIAFPQRDVHLDSVKPLEVRVLAENPDTDLTPADEEAA